MKGTSATRRIDDLGRVVIPKEVREKLRLFAGSSVDVSVSGENVVISKHSAVMNICDVAHICIQSFDDFDEFAIFITDTAIILASNTQAKNFNKEVPAKLFEKMLSAKNCLLQGEDVICFDQTKFASQAIFPIIANAEPCGALVVMSKKFCQNFDFAKTMHKFLQNYLNLV